LHSVHVSIKSCHLSVKYNEKSYLHNWLAIYSDLLSVNENWNLLLCWQPPFYPDLSLPVRVMREGSWTFRHRDDSAHFIQIVVTCHLILRNKSCFSSSAESSGCRNIVHPCGKSSEWHKESRNMKLQNA
jgi:hypothetical protein